MASKPAADPRRDVHRALDFVFEKLSWLPTVLAIAAAALGAILLSTIGELEHGDQIARLIGGIVSTTISAAITVVADVWNRRIADAQVYEVAQFSITLSNAIQPMTEYIAEMPNQDTPTRQRTLMKVIGHVGTSVPLLLNGVDNVRIVVYRFNASKTSLDVENSVGRRDKPKPFKKGDGGRGDAAFAMIKSGDALFVEDITVDQPSGWSGSGSGYRTFISAPIRADRGYGMLTVDAPNPGDLSKSDKEIVMVLATLLCIAFAEAERNA